VWYFEAVTDLNISKKCNLAFVSMQVSIEFDLSLPRYQHIYHAVWATFLKSQLR
jgi:hypothetical protein